MRVVTLGTGYVGLNTAVALAYLGHSVRGVDVDIEKVSKLKQKQAPIREAGLDALLSLSLDLTFTTDLASVIEDVDVIFIAVGTPSLPNGHADLSYVHAAAKNIAECLSPRRDVTIVVKSTVPIGVNTMLERQIREHISRRGECVDFLHFASNPEFLREGCALSDMFYPDRIVIGTQDDKAHAMLSELYAPILSQSFPPPDGISIPNPRPQSQCLRTDQTSAEMIKYASNAFLATKISYINELSGLCEKLGANISDVSLGMGMDHRIAPYFLRSGLGWGGSCFPKDTLALLGIASEYDYSLPIVEAAIAVNERQKHRIVQSVLSALKVVRGARVALLGITFKPNTDDVRHSPAVDLARHLTRLGARVFVHDPVGLANARRVYAEEGFDFCDTAYEAAEGAEAIMIATDWAEYRSLDWRRILESLAQPHLFDARNLLDRNAMLALGFKYYGF
ncbi:MAG: UDP-glucose/GDP-mannose dehydrogenase family protein [Proteobacteria bacterium]|nr:UDP-glucose/GDP-mannose dehydrogenase family protein [Pseudomonadota bacterium]